MGYEIKKQVVISDLEQSSEVWLKAKRRDERCGGNDAMVHLGRDLAMERVDTLLEELHDINTMEYVGGVTTSV